MLLVLGMIISKHFLLKRGQRGEEGVTNYFLLKKHALIPVGEGKGGRRVEKKEVRTKIEILK